MMSSGKVVFASVRGGLLYRKLYLIAEWSQLIEIGQDREEKDWHPRI